MTDESNGRGGELVILWGQHPPGKGIHAKSRKIVSSDVFGTQRPGREVNALAPRTQTLAAGLKSRYFFELWCFCLQSFIKREGEHSPAVLWAAFHAAVVAVAYAVE